MTRSGIDLGAACAIAVMAKAPRAGRSKTRLCPPLRANQAAALSAAFLRDMTDKIAAAARQVPIHGFVAHAEAGSEPLFEGLLAPGTGFVLADGAIGPSEATSVGVTGAGIAGAGITGLGRCLLQAIQAMLDQGFGAACVLNSDSPTLPYAVLVATARALLTPGERVVLGPAEDGGYYLLGMKTAHARLFANIAWSTDGVAAATRSRAQGLGLEIVEMPLWYDVDDRASLGQLVSDLAGGEPSRIQEASATETALRRMGLMASAPVPPLARSPMVHPAG